MLPLPPAQCTAFAHAPRNRFSFRPCLAPAFTPERSRRTTRRAAQQSRATVLWCLAGFGALQILLALAVERWRPEFRDPDYGGKLALLKQRLAKEPGRPLLLFLGSSRVLYGIRPELLPSCHTAAGEPLVFNFGLPRHGPLQNLVVLRRLLAEGIRPRWLVVEALPVALPVEDAGEDQVMADLLSWDDVAVLRPYCTHPLTLYARWARGRCVPWWTSRFCVLSHYCPSWVPWQYRAHTLRRTQDRDGWVGIWPDAARAFVEARTACDARLRSLRPRGFHIADLPDRALRDLLALCRRESIETAVLVAPEGEVFRGWYPLGASEQIDAYLTRLGREERVPVINARTWVHDKDFWDSHHLYPSGAALLTHRFAREALQPLLAGLPAEGTPYAAR